MIEKKLTKEEQAIIKNRDITQSLKSLGLLSIPKNYDPTIKKVETQKKLMESEK